jgi:hypothetical protein
MIALDLVALQRDEVDLRVDERAGERRAMRLLVAVATVQ